MTCRHEAARELALRCYSGPVARTENRAAHGNVCITEECAVCGARRDVNVNGMHVESGPWGPTADERMARARQLAVRAKALVVGVEPIAVRRSDGLVLRLSLDSDGTVLVAGDPHLDADAMAALCSQPVWLERARAARKAVLAAMVALAS